jgi:hypothetical protein
MDFRISNQDFLALLLDKAMSRRLKLCASSQGENIGICRISRAKKIVGANEEDVALVPMWLECFDMTK